ncbi:LysR substrate-binding domain-containing protein [Pseudoxanthomonas sp. JBR18]|uniref:LysR substrate-binding domain-containing protein n=1 Tax=Pseudoxanthomonas sp. JBR18 TaxID=2969308 RepID=UPI0023054285|nr:LysR substrate-binding domain-containing protein [Pseudoxanthomonas sp. JBR18]WCE03861.1 LysR family transcriptional regulator [Pseudoxanthomonas sp. JBR18]
MTALSELNLRHLQALTAIARQGSIAAATHEVSLSQPALTQAVARLERTLDHTLFERHPGGMNATPAMALLLPRIDRATGYLARGVQAARRTQRLPTLPALARRLTLSQLRALIAVEEAGSHSLAATRSGVSQPAIHRAIQELATLIDVPLLSRHGKTVQPTLAATRLLRFARLAMSELSAGMDELAALKSEGAGHLRIGTLPLARAILLPQVLSRFSTRFPHAVVQVVESPYAELLAHLREGSLDLLVGAMRHPAPVRDVIEEPLFDDDPVIVARSGHPLAGQALQFQRLLEYPWVIAASGAPVRSRWEQMFRDQHLEPPLLRIECGSVLVVRGLMLEDDWLTLMSRDQFLFERRSGLLCELGTAGQAVRREIGLTTRNDWRPTELQRQLVKLFREVSRERGSAAPAWPFRYG